MVNIAHSSAGARRHEDGARFGAGGFTASPLDLIYFSLREGSIQYIEYTVYCDQYTLLNTVFNIQYTVCSTRYTVHNIQYTLDPATSYNVKYPVRSIKYTLYSERETVYGVECHSVVLLVAPKNPCVQQILAAPERSLLEAASGQPRRGSLLGVQRSLSKLLAARSSKHTSQGRACRYIFASFREGSMQSRINVHRIHY